MIHIRKFNESLDFFIPEYRQKYFKEWYGISSDELEDYLVEISDITHVRVSTYLVHQLEIIIHIEGSFYEREIVKVGSDPISNSNTPYQDLPDMKISPNLKQALITFISRLKRAKTNYEIRVSGPHQSPDYIMTINLWEN